MSSTAWLHHELAQVVSAPPSLTVQPNSLLLAPPPSSASAATASTSQLSPSPPSPHSPLSTGSGSARPSNPDALLPELCTERQNSATRSIDTMSTLEMCQLINAEDAKVARAVADVVPVVSEVIDRIAERIADGGRLLMMGAGNSGRLGVLDLVGAGTDRDHDGPSINHCRLIFSCNSEQGWEGGLELAKDRYGLGLAAY